MSRSCPRLSLLSPPLAPHLTLHALAGVFEWRWEVLYFNELLSSDIIRVLWSWNFYGFWPYQFNPVTLHQLIYI